MSEHTCPNTALCQVMLTLLLALACTPHAPPAPWGVQLPPSLVQKLIIWLNGCGEKLAWKVLNFVCSLNPKLLQLYQYYSKFIRPWIKIVRKAATWILRNFVLPGGRR